MCLNSNEILFVFLSVQLLLLLLQPFYSSLDFVRNNPGEPVPEETFTLSHLSRSSIIPYLLFPFITTHGILQFNSHAWQSFWTICLPSFLWSTSWLGTLHFILHTFLHPNHCLLITEHVHATASCFAVVPKLCYIILVSRSTLYLELCCKSINLIDWL